mgnify:FL=1
MQMENIHVMHLGFFQLLFVEIFLLSSCSSLGWFLEACLYINKPIFLSFSFSYMTSHMFRFVCYSLA